VPPVIHIDADDDSDDSSEVVPLAAETKSSQVHEAPVFCHLNTLLYTHFSVFFLVTIHNGSYVSFYCYSLFIFIDCRFWAKM